jgi:hypothetical protein
MFLLDQSDFHCEVHTGRVHRLSLCPISLCAYKAVKLVDFIQYSYEHSQLSEMHKLLNVLSILQSIRPDPVNVANLKSCSF